jgi:CMP/dCMP kinase
VVDDLVIAIDGPVGSGKSTVARLVAQQLGCRHIDSGAVYRAVAWMVDQKKLNLEDADALAATAQQASISFSDSALLVNGKDVTEEIRSLTIAQLTSKIAVIPGVRDAVNIKLRELAKGGNVVMDGRDIGTVVLPDADLKIFLTAEIETRALRRQTELEAAGKKIVLEELVQQIKERDDRDSGRAVAPLCAADDAIVIDTDELDIDEVVARIAELCKKKRS